MTITITFERVKRGDIITAGVLTRLRVSQRDFAKASRGQLQSPQADQSRIYVSSRTSSPKIGVLANEEGSMYGQSRVAAMGRRVGIALPRQRRLHHCQADLWSKTLFAPAQTWAICHARFVSTASIPSMDSKAFSSSATSKCVKSNKQSGITK